MAEDHWESGGGEERWERAPLEADLLGLQGPCNVTYVPIVPNKPVELVLIGLSPHRNSACPLSTSLSIVHITRM